MRFGLIGYPIGHSLSPIMFGACYPHYSYDLIESPDFDEAYDLFLRGYDAVNVTAPFKEKAYLAADTADSITDTLRAANVLVKRDGHVEALNTDYLAVRSILIENHADSGKAVLVVGCGGAGRAAALAAADLGMETFIANRTPGKAASFCEQTGGCMHPASLAEIERISVYCGTVIYTLPVYIPETSGIPGTDKLIVEANYRDPHLSGNRYISGKFWLAAQALPGFAAMTGCIPDPQRILDAIPFTDNV